MNIYSGTIYIYRIKNTPFFIKGGLIFNLNINVEQIYREFNLKNPLENTLAKIYSFYEILNGVENDKGEILYDIIINYNTGGMSFSGGQDMGDYAIGGVLEDKKQTIEFYCSEYQLGKENTPPIPYGTVNYQEFYLLMQIYFGVYMDDEYKNELEKREENGEYDDIKKMLKYENWKGEYINLKKYIKEYLSQEKVQEYLKLKLMRKDISGAFDGLEIEKIYDKNWSEEKQKEHIEEINKEFGEEVIVSE